MADHGLGVQQVGVSEVVVNGDAAREAGGLDVFLGDLPKPSVRLRDDDPPRSHRLRDERRRIPAKGAHNPDVEVRSEFEEVQEGRERHRGREDGAPELRVGRDRRIHIGEGLQLRWKELLQIHGLEGSSNRWIRQNPMIAKKGNEPLAAPHARGESVSRA